MFRQQLYNSSSTQNVQNSPGRCDSRNQEFPVLSGSAWSAQHTAPVQRQEKRQVVLIQCTPANYSCSANKNIVLAGSGVTRCEGVAAPPQRHTELLAQGYVVQSGAEQGMRLLRASESRSTLWPPQPLDMIPWFTDNFCPVIKMKE